MKAIESALKSATPLLWGRCISEEEAQLLRRLREPRIPEWLVSAMLSIELVDSVWRIDSLYELSWQSPAGMELERKCYPGLDVCRLGYLPIGDCALGSGNPYFLYGESLEEGRGLTLVRVCHGYGDKEIVAPSFVDFIDQASGGGA